jgi:O-antigen/teichoic acid export membrane protein
LIELGQPEDPGVRTEVLRVVRRLLPNLIYLSFSSQITVWLISFCGSTASLAQLGALTRLGQAFALLSALAGAIIIPRFARLPGNARLILARYFQVLVLLSASTAIVVLLVGRFPAQVLLLLGHDYLGLTHEVTLYMCSSVLYVIAGIASSLANARGAVLDPVIGISLQLGCQVIGILLFGVTSIRGILWLAVFVAAAQIVMYTVNFVIQTMARPPARTIVA